MVCTVARSGLILEDGQLLPKTRVQFDKVSHLVWIQRHWRGGRSMAALTSRANCSPCDRRLGFWVECAGSPNFQFFLQGQAGSWKVDLSYTSSNSWSNLFFCPSPTIPPSHLFSHLLMPCKLQNLSLNLETVCKSYLGLYSQFCLAVS